MAMKPIGPADFFGSMTTLTSRTVDEKSKLALSSQVFMKMGKNGQVLFHRVPEKNLSNKIEKAYLASPKAQKARELAGQKIEKALSESGVRITENIRKALPSKNNLGNFSDLKNAFIEGKLKLDTAENVKAASQKAPTSESQVLSAVKDELSALDWGNPGCITTLFRGSSNGQTLITDFLAGTFSKPIENCTSNAINLALKTLSKSKNQDEALVTLHKATLKGLEDVGFTPEFNQLVFKMVDLVAEVASQKATIGTDQVIVDTISKALKEKVFATIFLRTLSLDLAENLRKNENELKESVKKETGNPALSGFKPVVVGALIQSLFSGAKDIEKKVGTGTGIIETMPQFYAYAFDNTQNNLSSFTAMQELKEAAGLG